MRLGRSIVVPIAFWLAGCASPYAPLSPRERAAFATSRRDVQPDEVRRAPDAFKGVAVAWTGVIERASFHEEGATPWVEYLVSHRRYDWQVDRSWQYWLSPTGEGRFKAVWPLNPAWDLRRMKALTLPGDMLIVYGKPQGLEDGVVDLGRAECVRLIPQIYVRIGVAGDAPGAEADRAITPPGMKR